MKYVGLIGEHMEPSIMNQAKAQLVRHEGLRLKPYRCTAGKLTIGVGRNLEDKGISQQEAYELLENDIRECEVQLLTEIPDIYLSLDLRLQRKAQELLAMQIASIHNLSFYLRLVTDARHHIEQGDFVAWKNSIIDQLGRRI